MKYEINLHEEAIEAAAMVKVAAAPQVKSTKTRKILNSTRHNDWAAKRELKFLRISSN